MLCFGLAVLTGLLGLSTALGAFVAGILIGAARKTEWVHAHLSPFRVVFVGAFFVSVGMLIDLRFFWAEWRAAVALLAAVWSRGAWSSTPYFGGLKITVLPIISAGISVVKISLRG